MGMTIEESISWIEKTILDTRRAEICALDRLALETAIDTMHKYQKIKEYISIPNRYGTMAEDCQKLEYVRKVVEDGKID